MKLTWYLFIFASSLLMAGRAIALPEFVRFGYFQCTSCHVSPSGGGALTAYGHGMAGERVSAKFTTGEPETDYLAQKPAWLVLGGSVRLLQTFVESSRAKEGRYFPMQRQLEIGLAHSGVTVTLAPAIVRTRDGAGQAKDEVELPRYQLKYELNESLTLRAGRFHARYGLMIPHHTSAIRRGLGFDHEAQTNNGEITWSNEQFEVTATALLGARALVKPTSTLGAESKGVGVVGAHFFADKHRLQASFLQRQNPGSREETLLGLSGIFSLGDQWHLLSELDQKATKDSSNGSRETTKRSFVTYHRLGFEAAQGVVPYLLHEVTFQDLRDGKTRADFSGVGANVFPYTHLEIEAQIGHVLIRQSYEYVTTAYLMLHLYL